MAASDIRVVVDTWVREQLALAEQPWLKYIQIFENRGEMMGASNPHPHCQTWATEHVPDEPAREQRAFRDHHDQSGGCLLCHYTALEVQRAERIVCGNDAFVAMVPFWAVWPFETLILSRRHCGSMEELTDAERDGLADILRRVTTRYDNLFSAPFPYSMGFHQRPVHDTAGDLWHLHAHFYPPLLRSATIRKFMVGFEMLGSPQRDLTAESAADALRRAGEVHYLDR
jgi:UDPglucose--hexose-1-phosphate uridylyltransferase